MGDQIDAGAAGQANRHDEDPFTLSRRGVLKLVLTAGMGLAAANVVPGIAWADGAGLSKQGVKARFLVGSDIHVQNGYLGYSDSGEDLSVVDKDGDEPTDSDKKLAYAFQIGQQIGGIDSYAFVGDLTDYGMITQYHKLLRVIKNANTQNTRVILCQGNHETYTPGSENFAARKRFEDQLKDFQTNYFPGGQKANKVVDVNGVKVITMGPDSKADSSYVEDQDFFLGALKQTTDGEPFLVLSHHQIPETTYTSHEWHGTYTKAMTDAMSKHPNLLHISGHSHATTEDERSIGQDFGFTAIQDGTLGAYYENERGKVDPDSGNGASVPPQTSDAYTKGKKISEASQCLIVDVNDDKTIKVYRVSLVRSRVENKGVVYLYKPWVIDVPAMVKSGNAKDAKAFPYTESRVSNNAPTFPLGAKVEVKPVADSADVHVTFPTAQPGSDSNLDMVHEYKLVATPKDAQKAQTVARRVFHDYYRPQAYIRKTWDVLFKGLAEKTTYTMSVYAQTSWNKEKDSGGIGTYPDSKGAAPASTSKALVSAAFTTNGLNRPASILDIDFSRGKADDAAGHKSQLFGGSKIVDDAELERTVLETDGNGGWRYELNEKDYDYFKDASTAELFVRLTDNIKDEQALFSNEESAGAGFEVSGDRDVKGNFEYWYHSGSYVMPNAKAEPKKWTHLMAVADGKNVTLYVNGAQASQKAAGQIDVPGPHYYYVGCDTDGSGQPQFISKAGTRIALARLYPRAFTADEVKKAYEAAVKGNVITVTFDSQGGTEVKAQEFKKAGSKVVVPANPTRKGYSFVGWYADKAATKLFAFSEGVKQNVTLYAKWVNAKQYEGGKGGYRGFPDAREGSFYVAEGWLDYGVDSGLMTGYKSGADKGKYGPFDNITRAMAAQVLYNLAGSPVVPAGAKGFDDLASSHWGLKAVMWANAVGVVTGYEDRDASGKGLKTYSNFGPDDPVTREDLATMMLRYAQKVAKVKTDVSTAKASRISGWNAVNDWARQAVAWCVNAGLLSGVKTLFGTEMQPTATAWRGSVAKMATVLRRDVLKL